jgi:glutathione peroxidase
MKYFCIPLVAVIVLVNSSIYNYTATNIDGDQVSFNDFRYKKILIVNIATGSSITGQLAELQQLQQQYADSLIVIGFPSSSFGHENKNNAEIKQFCQSQYGVSFLLAAKGSVKGNDMQPIYQWLTRKTENGEFNSEVKDDFQKYIVDRNGALIGVFKGSVSPLDNQVVSVITGSFN